jgi:hypothetical protein
MPEYCNLVISIHIHKYTWIVWRVVSSLLSWFLIRTIAMPWRLYTIGDKDHRHHYLSMYHNSAGQMCCMAAITR